MWFKCWIYFLQKVRMRKRHLLVGIIVCLILTLYLYNSSAKNPLSQTYQQANRMGNYVWSDRVNSVNTKLRENIVTTISGNHQRLTQKTNTINLAKIILPISVTHKKDLSIQPDKTTPSATLGNSPHSQLTIIQTNNTQFYEYPLKVSMDEVTAILRNPLTFQALEESVDKTRAYLKAHQPEFDVNSGACQCNRISDPCICCATITVNQCKLIQGKVCLNFTYLPVKQALLVNMTIDAHLLFESLINIKTPPQLCAGSKNSSGGVYVCSHLRYLSYGVEMQEEHKTRFSGCADILVKLQMRDVAILQLGCFKAPKSDSKNVLHDKIPAVLN